MFDNIAPKYDFLNHLLSMGIDITWRKKAIRIIGKRNPKAILDVATGTGDFALEAKSLNPERIVGIDISEEMLNVGRKKIHNKGFDELIEMIKADSEALPFKDNTFDAITVGFGVRNFAHLEVGLGEMLRVLKPGGQVAIIEISQPQSFPVKQVYNIYFKHILPTVGKMVSKDARAYTYLPESVTHFAQGQEFVDILHKVGYKDATCEPLTLGTASLYIASK
ncbi:bifunctional demethylmenaquinone methyltransferase/2-methoxy-6-polyprenyl-1,4-benzoquinol methylase UbiE [bacterium SCSIO 12643]|nr:bifunctional demethylmenaquinone methyltransferase/2-methoxy-6-polyprenyl-1,4-benzoquinol methylase UbiE [bacterium SCSIO 12643]